MFSFQISQIFTEKENCGPKYARSYMRRSSVYFRYGEYLSSQLYRPVT